MSAITAERTLPVQRLLEEAAHLSSPELNEFVSDLLRLRAERLAPRLSRAEAELLKVINFRRSPDAQLRFDHLIARRRANKLTSEERAELLALTDQSEHQAAERVRALGELAVLRGLSFTDLLRQLGL